MKLNPRGPIMEFTNSSGKNQKGLNEGKGLDFSFDIVNNSTSTYPP